MTWRLIIKPYCHSGSNLYNLLVAKSLVMIILDFEINSIILRMRDPRLIVRVVCSCYSLIKGTIGLYKLTITGRVQELYYKNIFIVTEYK